MECSSFAFVRRLFVSALLVCGAAVAHAAGYTPTLTTAYPQLAISNSAPQVVWATCNSGSAANWPSAYRTCDDGISQIMNIGFTFNFAGTNYTRWSMHTNGTIFFETNNVGTTGTGTATGASTYQPANLPTTNFGSPAKAALFPFWADLQKNASSSTALANNDPSQPGDASFYQYQVLTQPSGAQVLVIQLKNVVYWNTLPQLYVNMQIQLWSTGEIVYSYGAMQAMTTNPSLRVGLQSASGTYCHTLANNQTTSLSSQSFVYTWSASAPACGSLPGVNHYEIRHDGAATLCAEPVTVLACSSATSPCPAANIMGNIISIGSVSVTGVTTVTRSPASFSLQSSSPTSTVNLTWSSGSSGTATLGVSTSVSPTGATRCTNVAGTSTYGNCNISVTNSSCTPPPHHFEIQGPASGSNCGTHTFTIKAWADAAQTTAYTAATATGALAQSGNPASLPGLGAFSIPAGSSTTSITPISFPATGTTTFSTTPALTGATTCKFGSSTSCAFVVSGCDFNCVHTGTDPSTGTLRTKLAGAAFSFDVVARKSDGTVETTYASAADRTVTVELVDGSGTGTCASRSNLSPAVGSQSLVFAAANQGRKGVSFTVSDAYQNVRCRVTDDAATTVKGCSLDNFSVRPTVVTLNTTANATPPSSTAATTVQAGSNFTLGATTSAGTNYQGNLTLDTAKLTAQTTTQDATQVSGGTVGTLTPSTLPTNPATPSSNNATYSEVGYLYLAAGAYRDDSFTAVDQPSGCVATGTCDCVTDTASDNNLSTTLAGGKYGCHIGNAASSLGRFIPHHFDTMATGPLTCSATPGTVSVTASSTAVTGTGTDFTSSIVSGNTVRIGGVEYQVAAVTSRTALTLATPFAGATAVGVAISSCPTGESVYSGQGFNVQITAKNSASTTTKNYMGKFAKAVAFSPIAFRGGSAIAATAPGGTLAGGGAAATSFTSGTNSATQAVASFSFAAAPTLPTSVFVRASDTDGVASLQSPAANSVEGGVKVVSGRIQVANAYGSERLPLPIPITAQYFNPAANWVTSLTDGITSFDSNLVADSGNVVTAILNGLSGGVAVSGAGVGAVVAGRRNITLAAPGQSGNANISLNAPAHLPSTTGRATFGVYKSPLIYRRENY